MWVMLLPLHMVGKALAISMLHGTLNSQDAPRGGSFPSVPPSSHDRSNAVPQKHPVSPLLPRIVILCLSLCLRLFTCVCMCLHLCASVCSCLHLCACVCMCLDLCAFVYSFCMSLHVRALRFYVSLCVCVSLHVFACVCMCLHLCASVCDVRAHRELLSRAAAHRRAPPRTAAHRRAPPRTAALLHSVSAVRKTPPLYTRSFTLTSARTRS